MHVLIWVTHLLGVGHFHRAVRIARGLVAEGANVTIATGGFPLKNVRLGDFEVVQLDPVASPDVTFKRLVDPDGNDIGDEVLNARRDALIELARERRPAVILTELFPFGRWKFRSELVPLIEDQRALAKPPAIVASIRDILVPPKKPERLAVIRDLVTSYFDQILVHGDADFVRLEETLPLAGEFAERVVYTGYVVPDHAPDTDPDVGVGEVVVSAGGSAFGGHLLKTAIEARPETTLGTAPWRVLVGQGLSEQAFRDLSDLASHQSGIIIERARADFPELMTRARLSISQAGYNTVCDVLAAHIPAVLAPFAEADESEQSARVDLLAERGLAVVIKDDPLTPAAMCAAVDAAAEIKLDPSRMPLLDGARNTARAALEA
ncbi:MAG: glycosyltransferase, partial [Rhizobiales bacterium]|nr:glycosyltransferase [Hyphomicrobiales bacterium]